MKKRGIQIDEEQIDKEMENEDEHVSTDSSEDPELVTARI